MSDRTEHDNFGSNEVIPNERPAMPSLEWPDASPTERLVHDASFGHGVIAGALIVEREVERIKALTDPLTGLRNRRGFLEAAEQQIAQAQPRDKFVVLLADLDKFKHVNDEYGHDTGDELLRAVGHCLTSSFPGMITARFGGDEFTSLYKLEESEIQGASQSPSEIIKERIITAQQRCTESAKQVVGNEELDFSVSIGASALHVTAPGQPFNVLRDMLEQADSAMYRKKPDRLGHVRRRP